MKIIAHRGFSSHYPENTITAWDAAYNAGAHVIEADVRFSNDGVAIIAHDADLMRLFEVKEKPENLNYEQLAALRNDAGGKIATLVDVLSFAEQGKKILLDLKDETPASLVKLGNLLTLEVSAEQQKNVIIGAHAATTVAFFKAFGGVQILGFIPDPADIPAFVNAGSDIIRLWERDVTSDAVAAIKAMDVPVWVTTGGSGSHFATGDTDMARLHHFKALGVSGVLINDVTCAADAFERKDNEC